MKPTKNYHTHTYRCKHATQDVTAYCQSAIENGLHVLGISDHTALPDNRWPHIRMDIDELPDYCAAIETAQEKFSDLVILKGAECEYMPAYHSFFKDSLLGELEFDYLIGAAHFFPVDGEWVGSYGGVTSRKELQAYASYFIESMQTGLFAFMAHPDLFGNSYHRWDQDAIAISRDMFVAAAELGIPLEINGYGLRKPMIDTHDGQRRMYPWIPFWELACEYDVQFIVNSDAHSPDDIIGNMAEATAIGERLGLTPANLSFLEPDSPAEPNRR